MKVSSRIIVGFALLIAVAIGGLAYQVTIIHRLQSANSEISNVNFHAASIALEMLDQTRDLDEFSGKYFVLGGDSVYEKNIASLEQDFSKDLTELQATVHSSSERTQVTHLADAWDGFQKTFEKQKDRATSEELNVIPAPLSEALDRLRAQTATVYSAIQNEIRDEVAHVAELGTQAEWFSRLIAVIGLLIAIVVAVVIVRAITKPLKRLTQGTRKIAKGHFWHRLPDYGEDEFAELARDFNAMTEKLGELDQMKKDFVSHVSHDLKAPLASMRQIFHLMLQHIPGPLTEQQERLLRLGNNSAERLSSMVGNLLDVSRMEAGSMEYEIGAHDMVALVRSVAEAFELQAEEKAIRLEIEPEYPEIFVSCDRARIVQVAGNLFENALKFSPDRSLITVRIRCNPGGVEVSVIDSGPGVPAAHKNRIFEKFQQVQQQKKLTGQGVGLGLTICKTIVEGHHGEIRVEDNPGGGSIFSFVLPGATVNDVKVVARG